MMRKLLIAWSLLVTTCIVIPFDQLAQRFERWTCRRMGHRWNVDRCTRCGGTGR